MNILIFVGIMAVVASQFYLIYSIKKVKKAEKPKLTDEEKKRQEELRKHFESLMGYDYDEALRRNVKGD